MHRLLLTVLTVLTVWIVAACGEGEPECEGYLYVPSAQAVDRTPFCALERFEHDDYEEAGRCVCHGEVCEIDWQCDDFTVVDE